MWRPRFGALGKIGLEADGSLGGIEDLINYLLIINYLFVIYICIIS